MTRVERPAFSLGAIISTINIPAQHAAAPVPQTKSRLLFVFSRRSGARATYASIIRVGGKI
jgi:hypothetical protein